MQSLTKKYRNMPFLIRYADLFNQSNIMEQIIPRKLEGALDFESHYPQVLMVGSSQTGPDMEITKSEEYQQADLDAINKVTSEPIYDLLDRGGKQWRPLLGLMFADCFGRSNLQDFEANKDIYFAAGLTEIVHNGSLMVDDVEDGSHMRRGDLCSYKKFGTDVAVNAGNFMYLAPMNKLDQYVQPKLHENLLKIFMNEMQSLHFGQGWDIRWHNNKGKIPTEAQYFHMVENKTSVLPRLCLKFVCQMTDQSQEMTSEVVKFINSLGCAFQIQDDVIAVTSEEYRKERGVYCEDIQEGKRSLMAIHSYFYGWKGDQLLAILDEKSSDESRHREAIRILEVDGSIEYAKEKARLILLRAWRQIEPKLKNCDAKDDIHDLSRFLMDRKL